MEQKKGKKNQDRLNLVELKKVLDNAERQIRLAKQLLFNDLYKKDAESLSSENNIIEGIFDGVNMIGSDKKTYIVPSNYASKSKLVAGDILKLTITDDGRHTYKQIGPVIRKRVIGVLMENEGNYCVDCDGTIYNVLSASVTYMKAKEGSRLTLLVAKDKESDWAAIDNVVTI